MTPVHCPTCQIRFDPAAAETMPFCSERCRQIDLGRWLDEELGLPHEGGDEASLDFLGT